MGACSNVESTLQAPIHSLSRRCASLDVALPRRRSRALRAGRLNAWVGTAPFGEGS